MFVRHLFPLILFSACAVAAHAATHPMDALSADEIESAAAIVNASGKLDGAARFAIIRLHEMPKADVLAWKPGDAIARHAEVQAVTPGGFYRAIVDIDSKSLLSFDAITDGKPIMAVSDAFKAMNLIRTNDDWKKALAARGIDDPNDVTPLPFFRGYWGDEDDKKRNIYRVYGFLSNGQENYWGRPIGGLSAVVDIQNREVLRVVDTGAVPIPDGNSEFNDESNKTLNAFMKPVSCAQDGGSSYSLEGNVVRWGKWQFHVRFELQEGIVLSNITFDGRSVLYQASVSELFVPYMDPDEHWYFRNFMDAGEGGLGISAAPLMRGIDCPDNATLLSPVMANVSGKGQVYEDAVAVFERYCGDPAWRHMDPVSRKAYGNRAQVLVVRNVSTVGNYDYAFDWCFDAAGGIKVRVGATGICSAKPVKSLSAAEDTTGADGAHGRFVDRYTVAVNHDHYIAYRLDFDVDGVTNSFEKDRLTPVRFEGETPRTSGWVIESEIAKTENDAKLVVTPSAPTLWRILSGDTKNRNGYATSYHITPATTNYVSMLDDGDWPQKRGAFSKYNLYVTPYNPDERYAGGRTPNQNTGVDGLAVWSEANRPIEQTDIVAWYTLGFHHVVRAEDWPVMPTAWHEFYLRPFDFADTNPMMDTVNGD